MSKKAAMDLESRLATLEEELYRARIENSRLWWKIQTTLDPEDYAAFWAEMEAPAEPGSIQERAEKVELERFRQRQ